MRTVSTGVGLCVLGVCVLGATAISSSRNGTDAFAQSPVLSRSNDGNGIPEGDKPAGADRRSVADCETGLQSWFDPTPHYFSACTSDTTRQVSTLPFYSADVNADGVTDFFDASADRIYVQQSDATLKIFHERIDSSSGSSQQSLEVIFEVNQSILTEIRQVLPDPAGAELLIRREYAYQTWGWRDCDGDGDLDIVFALSAPYSPSSTPRQVWFENTGFQKAPAPNPYDLDQDGEVGAGDISVLLLNFD
jgi:hypothetical protein